MRTWTVAALSLFLSGCAFGELDLGSDEQPVIGGELTPAGMYPATGALIYAGQFGCTGTLIAPDVVLTAAHCVDPLVTGGENPGFTLALDANTATAGEIIAASSTLPHPQFDLFANLPNGVSQFYDIGLVLLSEPITDVPHAILPSPDEAANILVVDAQVELVGYGLTQLGGNAAGVKYHGIADLVEVGAFELRIARPGQQQNCNGDSGGPGYIDQGGGDLRLVGVVSRSPDSNPVCDHGGIHTRVEAYLEWIHQNAELPCGTGLSLPCEEPNTGCCSIAGSRSHLGGPAAFSSVLLLCTLLLRRRRRSSLSNLDSEETS